MESINAKYVSQKINKTRWRPVSQSTLQQPDIFVTGSWDNEVSQVSTKLICTKSKLLCQIAMCVLIIWNVILPGDP